MNKTLLVLCILLAVAAQAQAKRILVLGDSNGAAGNGWVEQLKLLRPNSEFINLSISGNTIGFDNGGHATLNTLRNINSYISRAGSVDMVLVLLGTNDCKAEFGKDFEKVIGNYERLIDSLIKAYPASRVVAITPPPMIEKEAKYKGGAAKVEKIGKQIKELAQKEKVEFIDIYSQMKPVYEELTKDGIHLTSEGYRLIAELIHKELRPSLFVIGDSISIHYGPYLEQYAAAYFRYDRKQDDGRVRAEENLDNPQGANGGDSRMVLDYIRRMISGGRLKCDYLLLNCGLHDIKTDVSNGKIQISLDEYVRNLDSIYHELASADMQLIWVNSTPVNEELHNTKGLPFNRYTRDVAAYNFVAERYFRSQGVPAIDVYSLSRAFPSEAYIDHVHYSDEYRKIQAAYIAGYLTNIK